MNGDVKNIYLIGFMGAGKSSVARKLAQQIGAKRIEMDQLIEEQEGMPFKNLCDRHALLLFDQLIHFNTLCADLLR